MASTAHKPEQYVEVSLVASLLQDLMRYSFDIRTFGKFPRQDAFLFLLETRVGEALNEMKVEWLPRRTRERIRRESKAIFEEEI